MKRLGLMALGALLCLAPLAACTTMEASAQGAVLSITHTTPAQSNAVAAAGDAYVLVARAVTVYVQAAHPAQATKDRIGAANNAAYAALQEARAAVKRDDSPAVALALKAWGDRFGALKSLLKSLGVPIPAGA